MTFKSYAAPKIYFAKSPAFSSTGQCDCGDCDCACADPAVDSLDWSTSSQTWKKAENIFFHAFGDEHWMAFNADSPAQPAALNRGAYTMLSRFNKPFSLKDLYDAYPALPKATIDAACLAFARLRLITPLKQPATVPNSPPQSPLVVWMHLTDRCNLRCAYCYLPHAPMDMPSEVGYAAVDATYRSALTHGYRKVKFKYAGGEPFLRFNDLLVLHRYAMRRGAEYGLTVEGVALSNGTLLDKEKARILKENGLRLMISLDGIGNYHNVHRFDPNGQGSFDKTARAIDAAISQGVIPDISVTVSGRNAAGLGELMKWILERELPFSLNFFRGNDLAASNLIFEDEAILKGMNAAFDAIEENLPRRSVLPSLLDRVNLSAPHRRTCGVGSNYMVFSPRGEVAKCQMQIHKTVAATHSPDPLGEIRADLAGVQNLDVDFKDECRFCQWRYWCTGGCPLETFRVTGSYSAQSPNCGIYKSLFLRALRLEGLRLLAYERNDLPIL